MRPLETASRSFNFDAPCYYLLLGINHYKRSGWTLYSRNKQGVAAGLSRDAGLQLRQVY